VDIEAFCHCGKADELHQGHLQLAGIEFQRLDAPGDARNVAVVVGAPDVDHLVETALELVEVVGDVGGEIGVDAVFALDDAILFVAKGRSTGTTWRRSVRRCMAALLFQQVNARATMPVSNSERSENQTSKWTPNCFEVVAAVRQLL
jgi:predicted ATP-grasp superfamily ATP-dependent carboligase